MSNNSPNPVSAVPSAQVGEYHMSSGGKMKWFKFMIYFQLFVSGISCILNMLFIVLNHIYFKKRQHLFVN